MLGLCLERLAPGKQSMSIQYYEVIVSDDSKDRSAEYFCYNKFPWVRYVHGPMRGPAANRNNGARLAKGDWLVFTDDDCLPNTGWLKAYVGAIKLYPGCHAFEGAIVPDNWDLLKKDMAECPVNTAGGCFWSANIMVQKDFFWQVGGFDEQFLIAAQEDQDLKDRIKNLTEIIFISNSLIVHPVRIISIKHKLNMLDQSIQNWMKYVRKQDKDLQSGIIQRSFTMHVSQTLKQLFNFRFKKATYHFMAGIKHFKLLME